jgi:hypothetical protein
VKLGNFRAGSTLPSDHKVLQHNKSDASLGYQLWQLFNAMTMHRTTKWGATPYEESTVGIQGIRDVQGCLPLLEAAVLTDYEIS